MVFRIVEFQHGIVQHLTWNHPQSGILKALPSVFSIPKHGVAGQGEMFSNLVCAPCFNSDRQVASRGAAVQQAYACDRVESVDFRS
jgi:hypothetical protein